MKKVPEIVWTGGPGAGKTTGIAYVSEKLRDWGWRVFIVPEVPTMVIGGGVPDIGRIAAGDFERCVKIQREFILGHLELRRFFQRLAAIFKDEKCVLFCDRGGMDAAAYMPRDYFDAALSADRLTLHDVRDSYEGVLFLVTAADGAAKFYTLLNNKARRETSEEAIVTDRKTLHAWVGHPHLRIIDNSTDFEGKMRRALAAIARMLGIPVPLEIERKFLLRRMPDLSGEDMKFAQKVLIEQMYLAPQDGVQLRIRRRSQGDSATFYKTRKIPIGSRTRHETENFIDPVEYLHLQALQDPQTGVIHKNRYCFPYRHQYFELDQFRNPAGLVLLEIELTEENDRVELPDFLEVDREVTDEPEYENYAIALRLGSGQW
ncbi:MAG: AAA family ATPase [bacterium]|nr:AAA family ATPase [bacterium]